MKLLLLIGVVAFAAASPSISPVNSLIKGIDTFSHNVVKAVVSDAPKNLVCSPISAHIVLSMAAFGARGNTEKILRSVLGLTDNEAVEKNHIRSLVDGLTKSSRHELRLANKVFLADDIVPTTDFIETTKNAFRSEAQKVDFGDSFAARKVINDWTALQTKNHIKEIVTEDDLRNGNSLVLVNAIYFQANWAIEFDDLYTTPQPFHVDGKSVGNVPTMWSQASYRHGELSDVNAKFIELPYQSNEDPHAVSMFIILPNKTDGLAELVKNLDKVTVQRLQQGKSGNIKLSLPKFKVESKIDLHEPLVGLGLGEIFSDKADFSGIVSPSQLRVTRIVQKAYIAVDEIGTAATVATQFHLGDRSAGDHLDTMDFKVDHPFLAVIATRAGVPLFSAVVSEPIF